MTPETSATSRAAEGMIKVNGAQLYHRARGTGPALLMIHGTGADSGCYDKVVARLSGDFTVLTYDRRGWSRSPMPAGWKQTSIEEQADDAAWLLKATGHAPALVFGSSSAGLTALDLVLRHPEVVRGAVLHESSAFTWLPQDFVQQQFAEMNALMGPAVASGGPRGGQQVFLAALAGDDGLESVADPEMLERWLSNAQFMFEYEFPSMLLGYQPDPAAIAAIKLPVRVMRAADSQPINAAASEWLAAQLKTDVLIAPGAHLGYGSRPGEFAAALRAALREVGACLRLGRIPDHRPR
jgi:pimeloyl-ACP methyl ester carboxylesterase